MLDVKTKKKIEEFARSKYAANDSFHSIPHALETAEFALRFAEKEKADLDVCWAAAMLHDICKNSQPDHAVEGAKQAKDFLLSLGAEREFAEKVFDAIFFHNKEFTDGSIERKILWDADKFPIMTLQGFKTRMLPYWEQKLGKLEGRKKSVYEYYFYFDRFRTKTARKEIRKHRKEVEGLIKKL